MQIDELFLPQFRLVFSYLTRQDNELEEEEIGIRRHERYIVTKICMENLKGRGRVGDLRAHEIILRWIRRTGYSCLMMGSSGGLL
jgi:hypothetical protein